MPIDDRGDLRHVMGYLGQAMYSFGPVDLSGGAGITLVQETASDVVDQNSVIKSRLGEDLTFNYHLDSTVVLSAQYFYAQHIFWRGQVQYMSFIHAGMTFAW